MIEIGRPIHAVRNRAVLDARRRSGAPGATLIDDSKNVRLALALRRRARRYRRILDDRPLLKFLYARSAIRHEIPPWKRRYSIFLPTPYELSISQRRSLNTHFSGCSKDRQECPSYKKRIRLEWDRHSCLSVKTRRNSAGSIEKSVGSKIILTPNQAPQSPPP
jgi:hypothetical protein